MNISSSLKAIAMSALLVVGLTGCGQPGPAESVGKKLDDTANEAGRKLSAAASKAGEKIGEQNAKAGVAIDDAEVTARVKAAIFAEPGLRTLQINVDTVQGVVSLSGAVDTPASRDRARILASAMAGVKGVDNRLLTKTGN